jgi:hypothetical protein
MPCNDPESFDTTAMRRIAITTPNVMVASARSRSCAPDNVATSPVFVNLGGSEQTLLAPFTSNPVLLVPMRFHRHSRSVYS